MANHLAKPIELHEGYEDMVNGCRRDFVAMRDDVLTAVDEYLPAHVRQYVRTRMARVETSLVDRAKAFGLSLKKYADVDRFIQAVRYNGVPNSRKHTVYVLARDHALMGESVPETADTA